MLQVLRCACCCGGVRFLQLPNLHRIEKPAAFHLQKGAKRLTSTCLVLRRPVKPCHVNLTQGTIVLKVPKHAAIHGSRKHVHVIDILSKNTIRPVHQSGTHGIPRHTAIRATSLHRPLYASLIACLVTRHVPGILHLDECAAPSTKTALF